MIVDDQRLMREGLKTILELEEDICVVGLAENGEDALYKMPESQPDVVLMDIRMPVMNGVECTQHMKSQYPGVRVLILTTFDDDEFIMDALKNGAAGYLLKDLSAEKLVGCIRDVYAGNSIMQPEIATKVISMLTGRIGGEGEPEPLTTEEFTNREISVLRLVGKGMSNLDIAKKLYISEGTVKNYLSSLYSKTNISERSKLIIYAIENNYV